jgi:hypothetical protein
MRDKQVGVLVLQETRLSQAETSLNEHWLYSQPSILAAIVMGKSGNSNSRPELWWLGIQNGSAEHSRNTF